MIDILISSRNDNPSELFKTLECLDGLEEELSFSVVLINDSNKNIEEESIPESLKNKIKVLKTKNRSGLASALNEGIRHCSNEFIARIDQGDISSHKRFIDQLNEFTLDDELCFIGAKSELKYIDDNGQIIKKRNSIGPLGWKKLRIILKRKNPLVHGSVMFRKNSLIEAGGYDERYMFAQDYELYLRFIKKNMKGIIIDNINHEHKFYTKKSSTIIKNRKSRYFGMKARLMHFAFSDYLIFLNLVFLFKDLFLMFLPQSLYKKIILKL
tara:strand:- start:2864 stop:3670 length:807 start_codon:yes stop_codon:yes gene_type:complete